VKSVSQAIRAGNIYINRNQIGAVVESQPFGGEGLSGTGPKAGGPHYVQRFLKPARAPETGDDGASASTTIDTATAQAAIDALEWHEPQPLETRDMPGPTGESNRLTHWPRGLVLCLGPTVQAARLQAGIARRMGCAALVVVPGATAPEGVDGFLDRDALRTLVGVQVVALWSEASDLRRARQALAKRSGALVPLVSTSDLESYCVHERHTCIDTTAAGGNASLLATTED
jgi:RHH-type proline utilization regulon transcriptional repressor/proline dehydrogenase/delta 1-pyrroline-5-carboxylate dehydrogenase